MTSLWAAVIPVGCLWALSERELGSPNHLHQHAIMKHRKHSGPEEGKLPISKYPFMERWSWSEASYVSANKYWRKKSAQFRKSDVKCLRCLAHAVWYYGKCTSGSSPRQPSHEVAFQKSSNCKIRSLWCSAISQQTASRAERKALSDKVLNI